MERLRRRVVLVVTLTMRSQFLMVCVAWSFVCAATTVSSAAELLHMDALGIVGTVLYVSGVILGFAAMAKAIRDMPE